ncbi:MAG: hypothetical protein A3F87_01215 [Omnitrophica WOR_2 bacterium RIFCSPLOWO2_12_FULL_51_24]|nr:MAG: hypothetical protein A3F87_01215 [Omnitrophica WOR_2 bacterium RIFCSPLOWO2_12_FULL_51_24]
MKDIKEIKEIMSFRLDKNRIKALAQIHQATKIPMTELLKQGIDRVIETYHIYIPDAEFRKQLNIVVQDSDEYLRRLANED